MTFEKLRKKTRRIIEEGLKLAKRSKMPADYCIPKCASCLAIEARMNIDEIDYKDSAITMFSSREDICMLNARDILAKKLDWIIN